MRSVRLVSYALLAVMALTLVTGAVLWHQGYRVYAVRTGSMSPTYPTGALVVDGPAPTRLPPTGNVVTFRTRGGLVTHRVVAHTISGATTKGDANRTPDAWTVPLTGMVGQVRTGIDRAGYALVFLQQPTGAPALALLGISVALAWSLFFPSRATRIPGRQD
jgi:signal peptidase I